MCLPFFIATVCVYFPNNFLPFFDTTWKVNLQILACRFTTALPKVTTQQNRHRSVGNVANADFTVRRMHGILYLFPLCLQLYSCSQKQSFHESCSWRKCSSSLLFYSVSKFLASFLFLYLLSNANRLCCS